MLNYYKVQNFFSIKDEVIVDLRATPSQYRSSKHPYSYRKGSCGNISSLSSIIIGPNASGKTNTLKAITFISRLITSQQNKIPMEPFSDGNQAKSCFEVNFSLSLKEYTYTLTLQEKRIVRESLKEKSISQKNQTTKLIFERTWSSTQQQFTVTNNGLKIPKDFHPSSKISLIASLNLLNQADPIAREIFAYWSSVLSNVTHYGTDTGDFLHGAVNSFKSLLEEESEFKELVLSIVRGLDLDIEEFVLKDNIYRLQHRSVLGDKIPLNLESSGTIKIIEMVYPLAKSLNGSGCLFVADEIDAYLHPRAVEGLVNLFRNRDSNPGQSQLLFSSHSHPIINLLDKQQILLSERDNESSTQIWRLDDVQGVRKHSNYFNQYISGVYGATPNITL